jgi:hypothetical protein
VISGLEEKDIFMWMSVVFSVEVECSVATALMFMSYILHHMIL